MLQEGTYNCRWKTPGPIGPNSYQPSLDGEDTLNYPYEGTGVSTFRTREQDHIYECNEILKLKNSNHSEIPKYQEIFKEMYIRK